MAGWPIRLEKAAVRVDDEARVYAEVWMPFLRRNASIPQISNAQTDIPRGIADSHATLTTVRETVDHTDLLHVREFANILQERKWIHEDAVYDYSDILRELDELIQALEREVETGMDAR